MIDRASSRVALTLVLAGAWACGGETPELAGPVGGSWSIDAEPILSIGVVEGDEAYQLHDVRDVTRLPDDRIAIAHQGTREVRVYDAGGRFLVASGEEGDGPGQWRRLASVRPLGNDTLVVVDHRLERLGFVDAATGDYLGAAGPARAASLRESRWHRRGLFLRAPADVDDPTVFEAVVEALDVGAGAAPTFVSLESDGRVWVLGAPSAPEPTLRLFDLDGVERATLRLPDRFRPLALEGDELLGVWRDDLDVEHVRVHRLEGPVSWPGPAPSEAAGRARDAAPLTSATSSDEVPELSAPFRNVASAQEIGYSRTMSYTADTQALDEIRDLELPEGARLDILDAGPSGWMGRIVDTATGAGCALLYGAYPPIHGIRPGAFSCWDAS